ncbi:MAG TPA: conjugal transfer protein [Candidatus Merdenecus merdavium]|nr:conjugal transfer protein [Candidatus Merdenecus merdavium]
MLWPICGNKIRDKIREDTILMNYPLYCPKCKQENLPLIVIVVDSRDEHLYSYQS